MTQKEEMGTCKHCGKPIWFDSIPGRGWRHKAEGGGGTDKCYSFVAEPLAPEAGREHSDEGICGPCSSEAGGLSECFAPEAVPETREPWYCPHSITDRKCVACLNRYVDKLGESLSALRRERDQLKARVGTWHDCKAQSDAVDRAQAETRKLESQVRDLTGELRTVDEALARRPALADCPDRYTKIFRACDEAAKADRLRSEVERLERIIKGRDATINDLFQETRRR